MAKKKDKVVVLTKEDLIYQPLELALSGYKATALQQNVVIAILRQLKSAIRELRNNSYLPEPKQMSLFNTELVKENYLKDGDLKFDIHMGELGVEPKHYPIAFNALYSMSDTIIYIPVGEGKYLRSKLFDTIDENVEKQVVNGVVFYKYKNRSPIATIVIHRQQAEFLFEPSKHIYDFLDDTAVMISQTFTKRIYMYLSRFKGLSEYIIDFWDFRRYIGTNDREAAINPETGEKMILYPLFSDFKKGIMNSAVAKLKELSEQNLCDFYFEYEPIYLKSKRAKNPDKLKFFFYLSEVGKAIQNDKRNIQIDIEVEGLMRKRLRQTDSQIIMLMKQVSEENKIAFGNKVRELVAYYDKKKKKPVVNIQSHANRALKNFLDDLKCQTIDETDKGEKNIDKTVSLPKIEDKKVEEILPKLSDEANERWETMLSIIERKVNVNAFKTWFKPMVPIKYQDGTLVIQIPTKFCYEYIEENFVDLMREAIHESFGEETKLLYNIKPK